MEPAAYEEMRQNSILLTILTTYLALRLFRLGVSLCARSDNGLLSKLTKENRVKVLDYVVHACCILMFVIGGIMSKGNFGVAAVICILGVVIEGMIWTGMLGSIIAMFKKKK